MVTQDGGESSQDPTVNPNDSQPQVVRVDDLSTIDQDLVRKAMTDGGPPQNPTSSDNSE